MDLPRPVFTGHADLCAPSSQWWLTAASENLTLRALRHVDGSNTIGELWMIWMCSGCSQYGIVKS